MQIDVSTIVAWREWRAAPCGSSRLLAYLVEHPGGHGLAELSHEVGVGLNTLKSALTRLKTAGKVRNTNRGLWQAIPPGPVIRTAAEIMALPPADAAMVRAIRQFVVWARDTGVIENGQARELWGMAEEFDPESS